MGLASYQDPETIDYPVFFCGRSNESYDVTQLIENNIFVTLYGKSGTGKTSLLNAGVFPLLRKDRFIPVSIRLGMEAIGTSFQQCIIDKILRALKKKGGSIQTIDVVPLADAENKEEYLWSHFARTRYLSSEGLVIFPVIVLDQFEEVFRDRHKDADILLRQIYFLMNETHALSDRTVNGSPYIYDFNFRFVTSIREDDLFRLEDSIDNNYLPEMKRCRYRLRNLSEEEAREVILVPGGDYFSKEDCDLIADRIISIAKEGNAHSVSSNILSLICSRVFADFQKTGASSITLSQVEKFLKGNPFEKFYKEAMKGFSQKERSYIETHLVDSSGRRNSIPESDFLLNVKGGERLFEGDRRILQRVSTSSGDKSFRVELIHDSFCDPLAALKAKRERWERIKKKLSRLSLVLLALLVILLYIGYKSNLPDVEPSSVAEFQLNDLNMRENGSYEIDGIVFSTATPSKEDLDEWKAEFREVCLEKIKSLPLDEYSIPKDMLDKDPCVVYLVLKSRSIEGREEKQSWFNLYSMMNQEQIDRLYDILYRENYKLAQIQLSGSSKESYIVYNQRAYDYKNSGDLDSALVTINKGINIEETHLAYLFDSKGEFYLDQGDVTKALEMWKKLIELDPAFLSRFESGTTVLHDGLLERGLIDE